MSLYGVMRTGVSGMNAQSSRLSTVADNIANSSTNGYKRATAEFASMLINSGSGDYTSGGVTTRLRYNVSEQGNLAYTTSVTDLAIAGNGFMIVTDGNGTPFLTRAGAFIPDGNGNLVNAAGFYLMGYDLRNGDPAPVAGGISGLSRVNIKASQLQAVASNKGIFAANLPSTATIVAAGSRPSDNVAGSTYTAKSSLVTYDSLGKEVVLDIYMTKTANNTWEVAVYNKADAAAGTNSFPYSSAALSTGTLDFDPTSGKLTTASLNALNIAIPGGVTLNLDLKGMVQLASDYRVLDASVNGNAPSPVDRIEIDPDGTLYTIYESGARVATFKIPLADVPSPDNLTALPGNVYMPSTDSGAVQVAFSTSGGMGSIVSGALESSTVDLASELTAMIESQRGYTANSKVFQTGSELLDVLVNLKR
jgi:flagellar hook protein FlgE